MKITALIENELGTNKKLEAEHGISLFVEVDEKKILFDTGKTGKFIDNANKLGISLKELDYVVISHGHYDHSGGLKRLINEVGPNFKLFVGKGFFDAKYKLKEDGEYEFVGNDFDKEYLEENNIPVEVIDKDITEVTENLAIYTNFERKEGFSNTNDTMFLKEKGKYVKDEFNDEIAIAIKRSRGLVLLVGCSHPGIVNVINSVSQREKMNVATIIGGTHLDNEKKEQISKIIQYFKEMDIDRIGACHCTGDQAQNILSAGLEEEYMDFNTGSVISDR